jgi:hypothetical protein
MAPPKHASWPLLRPAAITIHDNSNVGNSLCYYDFGLYHPCGFRLAKEPASYGNEPDQPRPQRQPGIGFNI